MRLNAGDERRRTWQRYIELFHQRRAGITEDILSASPDPAGSTPYDWLIEAAPPDGLALDVACGSGPAQRISCARKWVSVDRSPTELAVAASRGYPRLVQADATALPLAPAVFSAVTCAMAVMLFEPVEVALQEICRVLDPSGTAVVLLPSSRPLRSGDAWRYARLLAALHRVRPPFPNRLRKDDLTERLERSGLVVVESSCRRFAYPLRDRLAARRFVESLYTPGVAPRRMAAAVNLAESWVGSDIGIPLRRVICRKRSIPASD